MKLLKVRKIDRDFGIRHGCQPPNRLLNELPLGVDRLYQISQAHSDNRLMALFLYHFRRLEFGFGPRRNIFYPLLGDGIFTQDGAAWRHSRDLLKPQFARNYYRDLDVFREHVDNLISCISLDRKPVDLQPLFFRFTLDTTTALLFGESVYSLKTGDTKGEKTFDEAFNIAQEYLVKRYRLLDLYFLIGGRAFTNACASVHKFVDEITARGLQTLADTTHEKPDCYLFLDVVAQNSRDRIAL
ncbi:MAG: hypothetical protein M1835_008047 [Candelina submexicana]|nr:MAG: hypothetical protein M1835_008047 [Candelina submexicana]